ncbi:RUN domain-containing protein 1-like isoform X2 [Aphidius gifuensis]|uniref:RUN domain-containing protein 1-like isoform X2 n=1 Tax=Aphidius gifuensis TaxID=684658 RepID=UPI001CDCE739|nr:RUN domain-containing protein 1-like isoform X2 [Aphidius gifuensis]
MMSETISSSTTTTTITTTMASQDDDFIKSDDFDTSDDNDGPSGIRWAPVGANDGDSDFNDDYKCSDNMERLKLLEEEQEMLNSSLIALTTHFAQVQFRLRQIVDAPTSEKESLLKELEEFAFRGIPDVPSTLSLKNKLCNSIMQSSSSTTSSIYDANDKNEKLINDTDVQLKIDKQKTKQRELIEQLKIQLEDLEKYAYETDGQDLPQSVVLERQNLIINHLKEKLNFDIDDLCKLPIDDLRWQVDDALNNLVSPLKMKEQLVNQLKTQVADLERFIHYLQGEVSNDTLACTCACPIHLNTIKSSSTTTTSSSSSSRRDIDNSSTTINTVKKVLTLLHIYLLSQLGCSSSNNHHYDGQKKSKITWKDLRTRLDISIEHVLDIVDENNKSIDNDNSDYYEDDDDDDDDNGDIFISGQMKKKTNNNKLTGAVRKHLSICLRDLMQHGLCSDSNVNSVVPFVGCFPHKKTTLNTIHVWQIIVKYYEYKNGHRYCSSTAQKLSQSFNLDLVNDKCVSTKQSLLVTIGNIIASHTPYKRSFNSHFKAFVCAALNANKLVVWLKLILQCQYLLENHYASWSYVVKTGFQDAFYALDRLTNVKFELPVDLAVRQFTNIKDAF